MAVESVESKPSQPAPPSKKEAGPATGAFLSSLGLLILEIVLPAVVSAGALWFLFRNFNLWRLNRMLALVLFALALVVMSSMLVIFLDTVTSKKRRGYRKQGAKFGTGELTRLVKLALGGVLLPLALFTAAALVKIPVGGTAMDLFILTSQPPGQDTPVEKIATMVIRAKNPSTKALGIQALAGFHSTEGLGQLIRVLNEGEDALRNAWLFQSLSKAIASYGLQAKVPLIDTFNKASPSSRSKSTYASDDFFARCFAGSFESLRNEVKNQNPDPTDQEGQLAQVGAVEAQLKKNLVEIQVQPPLKDAGGDRRLGFVLRTFLDMNLSQDASLLQFAKSVAADVGYPVSVRGSALLLIGKLGGKNEYAVLFSFLQADNDVLLARALEAIVVLQAKKPR
jgi:hypothetical protein